MKSKYIWIAVCVLALGGIIWAAAVLPNQPDKLDNFATCLKDKGAVFYGAYWCPHCQATKALFGRSERLLPYVECSTPDGQGQNQVCTDKNIFNYPTWVMDKGFTVTSQSAPTSCPKGTKDPACSSFTNPNFNIWLFSNLVAGSEAQPTEKDGTWIFPSNSRLYGEMSLETFASVSGCELPK